MCRQRGGVSASISWDSGISGLSAITRLEGETHTFGIETHLKHVLKLNTVIRFIYLNSSLSLCVCVSSPHAAVLQTQAVCVWT